MSQFWPVGEAGERSTHHQESSEQTPLEKAGPRATIRHPAHVQRFSPGLLPVYLSSDIDLDLRSLLFGFWLDFISCKLNPVLR